MLHDFNNFSPNFFDFFQIYGIIIIGLLCRDILTLIPLQSGLTDKKS